MLQAIRNFFGRAKKIIVESRMFHIRAAIDEDGRAQELLHPDWTRVSGYIVGTGAIADIIAAAGLPAGHTLFLDSIVVTTTAQDVVTLNFGAAVLGIFDIPANDGREYNIPYAGQVCTGLAAIRITAANTSEISIFGRLVKNLDG